MDENSGDMYNSCNNVAPSLAHAQDTLWRARLRSHPQLSQPQPGLQLGVQQGETSIGVQPFQSISQGETSIGVQPFQSISQFLESSGINLTPSSTSDTHTKEVYCLPDLSWPIPANHETALDSAEVVFTLPGPETITCFQSDTPYRFEMSSSPDDVLPLELEDLEESSQDGSKMGIKKKRKSNPHLQHHGACYQCRRKKWRCSNNRPCEKCIVYGTAQSCDKPEYSEYFPLERPLPSRMWIEIQDDAYTNMVAMKNASVSEGVNFALVRITWEIGISVNKVLQALRHLPPNVKKVIDESIQAVQAHAQRRLMKAEACSTSLKELVAKQEVGRISALSSHGQVDDPPEASDQRWGHGRWLSIEYDKYTSTRKYCKVGSACAELRGYHPEEFLSRFAENNLPIHATHFDMLCIAMDSICRYQQNTFIRYWRLRKHTIDPQVFVTVFVRCCIIRDFDAFGRKIRTSMVYDYIDEDEFERLSKTQEDGNSDDLLAISLLPRRSFKEFMSEHKRELQYAGKLMDMRKKRSGKEKLDEFVKRLQQNIKKLMAE